MQSTATIQSKCYGKGSQKRFPTKFKHRSRKMGSWLQMQSIMPEVNSKADKEEVVRKRHQFVCLAGFHKQYFPKQYFQIGKKGWDLSKGFPHFWAGMFFFPLQKV